MAVGSRKIVNTGSRKVIGKFPSLKMNTAIWWESQIERDYIYLLESDPMVVSYKGQPFSIDYISRGKRRHYTPDFWVDRGDSQEIIEVKPVHQINSEKNQTLFHQINFLCQERGLKFNVVTDEMIRIQPLLDNLKLLYKYARTPLTLNQYLACRYYLNEREPLSLQQIWQALEPENISKNHLYKLLYFGFFQVDLMRPINSESLIRLPSQEKDFVKLISRNR